MFWIKITIARILLSILFIYLLIFLIPLQYLRLGKKFQMKPAFKVEELFKEWIYILTHNDFWRLEKCQKN